jgi:nucleotide-binding universal stress UspA family protein
MLPTYRSILVPIDFSPVSRLVVAHAVSLARRFEASAHVIHTWELPPPLRPDLTVWTGDIRPSLELEAREESKRTLRALLDDPEFHLQGLTSEILHGHPYEQIIATAEARKCDLIVMGTHGRTGVSHLLMGSVAEKVMRHARCPVLTLRSPPAGA